MLQEKIADVQEILKKYKPNEPETSMPPPPLPSNGNGKAMSATVGDEDDEDGYDQGRSYKCGSS